MKRLFKFVTTCCLAASLVGCGSSSSDGGTASSADATTMHIEMTTAPVGMHPLKTNDSASAYVTGQIFETLYQRTADGTSYEPLLAAEMPEYSDDGLTATIKLRDDVKFQDGTPFTAEAVGYMIDSTKDPDYGSMRMSIVESIDSYDIPDDHTIVLHLAYVDGVLVAKLAHSNAAIINPELDKSKDLMVDPSGAGTGPYKYVSSVSGSNYVLEANPDYWGGEPAVKKIQYDVVADESTAIARLQTGEADFYATVSSDSYNTASNISGYTLVNEESSAVTYLALRSTEETSMNPLMANADFRKALIEAIDFDSYVDTMLNGLASRSQSIVGPTLVGYSEEMEDAGYKYDAEDAKKIIDENNWAGQTVTLYVSTRETMQDLAVYMQSQLAEVGITLDIVSEEWASYLSNGSQDKKFDMIVLSWSNVTGDGEQMLEPNFSTENGTRVKYNNAEFDADTEASVLTTDLDERKAAMLKAVQKIQGDAIVTPCYTSNTIYVYNSNKFSDVKIDAGGLYNIKDVKVVGA